jgi:CHAD domain-containing protein
MPPTDQSFRGAADAGAPRLAGLPGVRRTEPAREEVLEVERFDTDDGRLAAAGMVLERRADGWHLDLGDDRLHLPPGGADVPEDLAALLRGTVRDRVLRPVGHSRVVRTATALVGDDGVVAEIVLDRVTVATLGASTEVRAWTEAHLPADLPRRLRKAVTARLAEDGLRPGGRSAAAELDRLLAPPPRRSPVGKRTAGAAVLAYLSEQADRLAAEDRRVRRDEPDAVHQMRVASRRMRSALQAYRPLFEADRVEPVIDGLRELGRVLAPARDAEVLRERITGGLAALPPELRLGAVEAFTVRHFARVESEARAAVLTELDGDRYAALRSALDSLLTEPPLTARAGRKARRELAAHVDRTGRRLDRALRDADDDEGVHAARKAGKRLRYATEVAAPVLGRSATKRTRALKDLQEALGEHQDTVVARAALRELGAAAHLSGENGFSFGILHGRDAQRAAEIERTLPALLESSRR